MKWATRKNMQIDRAASVWLIKKYIDQHAEIEFIEENQILKCTENGVLTFDAKDAKYRHLEDENGGKYGEKCTFQVIMSEFGLDNKYPALDFLAKIVYAADIGHKINSFVPKEGYGLWAVTKGFSITIPNDLDKMDTLMNIFDALYAYCEFCTSTIK